MNFVYMDHEFAPSGKRSWRCTKCKGEVAVKGDDFLKETTATVTAWCPNNDRHPVDFNPLRDNPRDYDIDPPSDPDSMGEY